MYVWIYVEATDCYVANPQEQECLPVVDFVCTA